MSDFSAESLSALMDSEAEELEVRRLLAQAESDAGIRARWSRYHTARAVLQKDQLQYAHIDISALVSEQLENEPVHSAASEAIADVQPAKTTFSLKPLAGLAVAASVTAAVFFGVQGLDRAESASPSQSLVASAQLPGAERTVRTLPDAAAGEQARVAAAKFAAVQRARMQTLMRLHAQQASVNGSQGILPLARAANYEVE